MVINHLLNGMILQVVNNFLSTPTSPPTKVGWNLTRGWWLNNQPMVKNMRKSKWLHLPQIGVNIQQKLIETTT